METTTNTKQFTSLFDNKVLSRIERMRLNPTRRLTNRSRGEHVSGKGGSSTDFVDYRNYVAGDDVRNVDWNIFSRLHKPYLKLFSHEEEMHVVLLVDASSSMMFEGKLDRARQLAAALGIMGLMNIERVSAYSCNHVGAEPTVLSPCTGRASMKRLFDFLENIEGGGNFPIEEAVDAVLKRHRGRGIIVLLSDFLIHLGKLKLVWVQCATVSLRGSVHAKVKLHNGKFILVTDVTFCIALIILVKFKINLWQLWQHICVSKHCAEVISLL